MKPFLNTFVLLVAAMLLLLWVAMQLAAAKVLVPPTLVTGISYSVVYSQGWTPAAVGIPAAFHLVLFVLLNVYLLVRVGRAKVLTPFRAALPSCGYTVLLMALSLRYWLTPIAHHARDGALGGFRSGLQIQGVTHVWLYGFLNLIAFAAAFVAICWLAEKRAGTRSWLTFNAALYASLFFILFPWLGGMP
jgi:hypothetical protein